MGRSTKKTGQKAGKRFPITNVCTTSRPHPRHDAGQRPLGHGGEPERPQEAEALLVELVDADAQRPVGDVLCVAPGGRDGARGWVGPGRGPPRNPENYFLDPKKSEAVHGTGGELCTSARNAQDGGGGGTGTTTQEA